MPASPTTQTKPPTEDSSSTDVNVAVLIGSLSSDPVERTLPSGDVIASYEVTTRSGAGTQTVPVAWFNAPKRRQKLRGGDTVVVTGHVRRRFFRAGGATASRTKVLADRVVRRTPAAAAALVVMMHNAADEVEHG